ncbi:MAG: hypothetical protein QOJ30_1496 [Pseudonocardiales bacterium]|jgi:nucleotide-binding universal stress UspA family protein|nr:hypothetical protein [Pseudonocardiales bacterium]
MSSRSTGLPVVAGIDGSEQGMDAARWAAAEAARRGAPLRLVRAYHWPPSAGNEGTDLLRDLARRQLWAAASAARTVAPGVTVQRRHVDGDAIDVLAAESADARMVVVGTRGLGGFTELLVGSVAGGLAVRAVSPVIGVRGARGEVEQLATPDRVRPVVVGVDGSPASEAALAFAVQTADAWGAPLVAVHSWTDADADHPELSLRDLLDAAETEEKEVLAERLAGWSGKYPDIRIRREVVRGSAARALRERSENARLVVVGSRGRGWATRMLLGSVGRALLHHAHCPVAIVRPEEAATTKR